MPGDPAELLAVLQEQERMLVFDRFDNGDAWNLGVRLREAGLAEGLPIVISIRRNGQRLFHAALPGSSSDNDSWADRKAAVVERYGHSSYLVGTEFRAGGKEFDTHARLDPGRFAAHGGSFPVLIRNVGCVGSITVSGLPQADDHALVVAAVEAFLTGTE
jgi:uncharacterized protein (UPF0303 family)